MKLRSIKLLTALFSLILLTASSTFGQFDFPGSSSADKVDVSTYRSVDVVHPGSEFFLAVALNIQDRWHVNAHIPTYDYLIGTQLTIKDTNELQVVGISYPEPKQYRFAFADDILDVYEGLSYIYIKISAPWDLTPAEYSITGTLRVQACDDEICLAPSDIPVTVNIPVVGFEVPANQINTDIFTAEAISKIGALRVPETTDEAAELAALFDEGNLLIAFGVIFLVGLALNLTPCVYPMLTVTVSVFGAQTDTKTLRVFLKALIYVLGIATMYSMLGVGTALSGGLFGGILQSTYVLVGIGVLFFLLALSLFGLYEIQIPYWLTNKLGGAQTAGILGIYISGLVVGIFAAPCIGPPIIALLALVGQKADPVFGFGAFFILSLGLGFPYLILGTFSGLLSKLPKSGAWMNWVKKVLGVVIIGVGLFYISLAYDPSLIYILIPITLVVGGLYLGFIERSQSVSAVFPWIKRVVGIGAVTVGIIFYLTGQKPSLEWEPYSPERLTEANEKNKPAVLYFSANWCIPCLELDRLTFTDQQVIYEMSRFVLLKIDLTNYDSPESQEIRTAYNIAGVPTIVFIDDRGNEVSTIRAVGYIPSSDLLDRVESLKAEMAAYIE